MKRGSKNRRGSHIDVILSFVIFISFVIFFYAMIQPNITAREGKTAFLNYMESEIARNLSGRDLTAISILAEPQNPHTCLQLTGFAANAGISSLNLVLENSTGSIFPAYKSGGDLYIDMAADPNSKLFNAYYSPDFEVIEDNSLGGCTALILDTPPNSYSINREESYTYSYIWGNDIVKLIESYNSDYNSVKEQFDISEVNNFGFDFTYQDGTVIGTQNNIPASAVVYSGNSPVVYVSEGGGLEAGNLIVRVW
jgi:hypothetical protein